jgi:hypothetical protein
VRAEKIVHVMETFTEKEAKEEDDEAFDRQLQAVNKNVLMF